MSSTILQSIAEKLGLRRPPPKVVRRAAGAAAPAAAAATAGEEELTRRIEKLLASQPTVEAGRVNLIGLDKAREALGPKWPKMAERAEEIVRRAIERRLTPADVYTRVDELSYIIVFAQIAGQAAQVKCSLIADEIAKRLLGEDLPSGLLGVRTAVKEVNGNIDLRDAAEIGAVASALRPTAVTSGRSSAERAGSERAGSDRSGANGLAGDGLEGMDAPPSDRASGGALTERSIYDGSAYELDPAEPEPELGPRFIYRPIWDIQRNAVATFLCASTDPTPVPAGVGAPVDANAIFDRDMQVLHHVLNDARKLAANRRRLLLGIPVHFESLARNLRRATYVRLCQSVGLPEKLLIFEVIGIPDGIPLNRLIETIGYLKSFARAILARAPLEQTSFWPSSESGILGVGHDIGRETAREAQLIPMLEKFAAAANKSGLRAYALGLRSRSLAGAAIGAGFDYIAGDAVTPVVEAPGEVQRFGLYDLYKQQRATAR